VLALPACRNCQPGKLNTNVRRIPRLDQQF
jgi:hypothetical protein